MSNDSETDGEGKAGKSNAVKHKPLSSSLSSVSNIDVENLNKLLKLAKSLQIPENVNKHQVKDRSITGGSSIMEKNGNGMVELINGTGIMVDEWQLHTIQKTYKKKPREMVRKLMKLIIGEEELKLSSPTGKNGRKPIPTDVYEAVEKFVNDNAPKSRYKISHKRYREVLTALCATLRNKKSNSNKSALKDSKESRKKKNEVKSDVKKQDQKEVSNKEEYEVSENDQTKHLPRAEEEDKTEDKYIKECFEKFKKESDEEIRQLKEQLMKKEKEEMIRKAEKEKQDKENEERIRREIYEMLNKEKDEEIKKIKEMYMTEKREQDLDEKNEPKDIILNQKHKDEQYENKETHPKKRKVEKTKKKN